MTTRIARLTALAAAAALGCVGRTDTGEIVHDAGPPEPEAVPETVATAPGEPELPPLPESGTSKGIEIGALPTQPASAIELRRLGRWTYSGIRESRRAVIRESTAWHRAWADIGAAGVPPPVDFSREIVVLAAMGQQRHGGVEIRVAGAAYSGDRLSIDVVEVTPAPTCITTAALTQPVDVVALPRREIALWSFRERKETRRC